MNLRVTSLGVKRVFALAIEMVERAQLVRQETTTVLRVCAVVRGQQEDVWWIGSDVRF